MDSNAIDPISFPPPRDSSPFTPPTPSRSPRLDANGRRRSAFTEVGLNDDDLDLTVKSKARRPGQVRFGSKVRVHTTEDDDGQDELHPLKDENPVVVEKSPSHTVTYLRLSFFTFLLAFLVPALQTSIWTTITPTPPIGAEAGPIPDSPSRIRERDAQLAPRQSSSTYDPTNYCKRWSQQSALVNGTLYLFGGRSTTEAEQDSDTWNNDFLYVDLTTDWDISSPSMSALPQPSALPAVANGFLWNSYTALFMYGGEYSDTPTTYPSPFALYSYDLTASTWSSFPTPTTTAGDNSDGGGSTVQDSAEGAGVNVPSLGRGYYFGGHQDFLTTYGWSDWVARIYLKSMIEYTFPGHSNAAIDGDPTAGSGGIWRNITTGGIQTSDGFTERADGILIYVPGFGADGILLGLAGGTNETFTEMNVIDVFDIATSTWYKQSTSGTTPGYRVNPCAVALSASDGSSVNVYMFGGQNLQPYQDQTQYNDMWILTVPSFTWISVDTTGQSVPYGRSGHTCNVWNSQMVVVGGYVNANISCDSPGVYVFDTSALEWINSYSATGNEKTNPLNLQSSQESNSSALEGSYGYTVPKVVQKIIGGNSMGGATVTSPSATATAGPFATGKPFTYSITASVTTETSLSTNAAGSVVTQTSVATAGVGSTSSNSGGGGNKTNVAAIAVGSVAGVLFVVAAYLAFCVIIYRRHLSIYKNHVAAAQRANMGLDNQARTGLLFPQDSSDNRQRSSEEEAGTGSSARRGQGQYHPIPNSSKEGSYGYGSGSGNRSGGRQVGDTSDSKSISSVEDLLGGGEPSFLGVVLNPRRTLRVTNS